MSQSVLFKTKTPRDQQYLAWLRKQGCCLCAMPAEASHHGLRGMSIKPSDYETIPLCRRHHQRYHDTGSPHTMLDGMTRDERREWFGRMAARYVDRYREG